MSEIPEEQPSTGVLGRIGSWFSPWKGKSPTSPTESESPTGDQDPKTEGAKEIKEEESVGIQAENQDWKEKEEEKDHNSRPDLVGFPRYSFFCEEKDATQSAHRLHSALSWADTREGGSKEKEEFGWRKKRTGKEGTEESSNCTSVSGNLEKNASHLTHHSSYFKQGNAQPEAQTPAQTGKTLHVYLEETSVIHRGNDHQIGQEVVRTKVTERLQVLPKAQSSLSVDLHPSWTGAEKTERRNITCEAGTQRHYNALVGVSEKSNKDSQSETEPDREQTEEDTMGRKNAARRRHRKNSQGDGGQSPLSPTSDNTTGPSAEGKSPQSQAKELYLNSSHEHNLTSQASPTGVENDASCPDRDKQMDNPQGSNSVPADAAAGGVDGGADMEDNDIYMVERKTETPEAKRRSMKVSRSEVKLFRKCVPLNPGQSPAEDNNHQHLNSGLTDAKKGEQQKDEKRLETEIDARLPNLKKIEEEPKPVGRKLADKIGLFERQALVGAHKKTLQTPRSADVSPVRKVTDRLKAEYELPAQRSKSAERQATPSRSKPSALVEVKSLSVKDRIRNLTEASKSEAKVKTVSSSQLPQKTAMTGMSKKPVSTVAGATSHLKNPESQDQLDAKEQIQTKETSLKPDGQGDKSMKMVAPIPEEQQRDQETTSKQGRENDKHTGSKSDNTEEGACDSPEATDSVSPQSKGPSRTGSRSKRRKGRETPSPISPNSDNKAASQPEATAIKQEQVDDSVVTVSTDKVSSPSSKAVENKSGKQADGEQKDNEKGKVKTLDHAACTKEDIVKTVNRAERLPEEHVDRKEPNTACHNGATKKSIERESVIPAQKEQEEKVESGSLVSKEDSKDSREPSSSSSSSQPVEGGPSVGHESLINPPQKEKEPAAQPETESHKKEQQSKTKQLPQHKHTEPIVAENKSGKKEAEGGTEKANLGETKEGGKPEELLHGGKNTSESKTSVSGHSNKDKQLSVAKVDETSTEEVVPTSASGKGKRNNSEQVSPAATDSNLTSIDAPGSVKPAAASLQENISLLATSHTNEAQTESHNKEPTRAEDSCQLETKPGTETEPLTTAAGPQSNSVSVEKIESSLDDSCTHRGNGVTLSSSEPITGATAAVDEVSVKASSDSSQQMDNMEDKVLTFEKVLVVSVPEAETTQGAVQDDGEHISSFKTERKSSGNVKDLASRPLDVPPNLPVRDILKVTDANKELPPKLPSIPGGDMRSQPFIVKKDLANDNATQSPKPPSPLNTKKPSPDSSQRPALRHLPLPRGLSKDDSSKQQDAPSSWLDVDFPKRKLKVSEPRLTSSGSESNLLDTSGELDDDDFVEKIKKLCAPFSLPPRKHNHLRQPQPPFAMPAIKEDRFEKIFDPEEFQFGLRKKKHFSLDTSPSILAKLQGVDTKSVIKPARASLADRSMLLSSLDTKDKPPVQTEEDTKEEKEEKVKVKSRLEGSCVLSSLTSSSFRGMRNAAQTQAESSSSGEVSPSRTPHHSPPPLSQPPPPSPTTSTPVKDIPTLSLREETQAAGAVANDSGPSLPSFNDIKLPDYLEKRLHREPAKPAATTQEREKFNTKVCENMTTLVSGGEVDQAAKPLPSFPDAAPPCFPVIPPTMNTTKPLSQEISAKHERIPKGFHRRPGKMVLFEKAEFCGQAYEIYRDVTDATCLQLSSLISVKVVRGCWVLYEKPDFQGRCIALEEGGIELNNMWAEVDLETEEAQDLPPMQIGSIRHAVWDYSLPHIDLFTEPEGHGRVTPYHDDAVETGSFGIPLSTASIQVHSGVWLVFSDPGFQGMLSVLETGVYPFPEAWGFPAPFVGSLRPLKMDGFKVENPSDVRALVYEKPGFEGDFLEIDSEIFSFSESEGGESEMLNMKSIGSLKILGGLWVGYSLPGFEGQQFILEEGEYLDFNDWGGAQNLLSLQPVLSDFVCPHMKMFSDKDFGNLGANIDLTVPVINMNDNDYGMKTQSIDVISGVWVAFEEPGFCGESYILEKGLYGSPEDWGALKPRIGSVMSVRLDDFENAAKFKVQIFSDPGFQGSVLTLEDGVTSLQDSFSVGSCKVVAGSWMVFDGEDFAGRMHVLEVGSYADLRAVGCNEGSSSIRSLQPVGYEFSLPSITLFERCGLRGKRVVLADGSVNLQLSEGCSRVQSVLVEGGIWVLYEGINYLGAQILLRPGEILDWRSFSSWNKIGSARPLLQKQAHFRLRNRHSGLMMSVTGDLEDIKLLRIQEKEETDGLEQIWIYQNGFLHCKLLEECRLCPSGSVVMSGSRVGLSPPPEPQVHLWNISPEGFIKHISSANLVLEVKGGKEYDKNQVILNSLDPKKPQQRWDVEIL